jgi:hypothetical protein
MCLYQLQGFDRWILDVEKLSCLDGLWMEYCSIGNVNNRMWQPHWFPLAHVKGRKSAELLSVTSRCGLARRRTMAKRSRLGDQSCSKTFLERVGESWSQDEMHLASYISFPQRDYTD